MAPTEILARLTRFVTDELLDGDGDALTETTPLLEWGVLDSLSMLALLAFIEEHIGTRVPDERVRPEHFQNLGRLTALLSELATTAPPEPPPPDLAATGATPARVVSRVANAGHQVVLRDVAVPSGGTRPVMHAPGPDPAWLLIPGPLQPSSSWGAMLRTQVDHAATWAPSLLGLGPDEPGTEVVTLSAQVDGLLELEPLLSDEPLVLVGHGLGGAIAAEIARRRPHRVRALVVVAFGLLDDPKAWWREVAGLSDDPDAYLRRSHHHVPDLTPLLRARMTSVLQSPAYRAFLRPEEAASLSTVFDGVDVPTLFLGGESDRIVPARALEQAAARVPGSRLEWLARCGHLAPLERSQELLSAIRTFVAPLRSLERV